MGQWKVQSILPVVSPKHWEVPAYLGMTRVPRNASSYQRWSVRHPVGYHVPYESEVSACHKLCSVEQVVFIRNSFAKYEPRKKNCRWKLLYKNIPYKYCCVNKQQKGENFWITGSMLDKNQTLKTFIFLRWDTEHIMYESKQPKYQMLVLWKSAWSSWSFLCKALKCC